MKKTEEINKKIFKEKFKVSKSAKTLKKCKTDSNIKKLVPFYTKNLKWLILVIVLSFVYATFAFLAPVLEGKMLAEFSNLNFKAILIFGGALSGMLMFKQVTTNLWSMAVLHLNSKVDFALKHKLVSSLMGLKAKNFDEINSGLFVTRISRDTTVLAEFFDEITDDFSTVLMNIAFIIYTFFINVWIAVYLVCNLVIIYFYNSFELQKVKKLRKEYRKKDENVVGSYTELIRGIRDIKALNAKEQMQMKIDVEQLGKINAFKKQQHIRRTLHRFRDAIQAVLDFGFIALSCYLLYKNNLILESFFVVIIYKRNLMGVVKAIANIRNQIMEGEISAQRVFEIIDSNKFENENFGHYQVENLSGRVVFDNVKFAYKTEKPLFDKLSFEIKPNTLNAFVGKSGEGKSTILELILKNYEITNGDIKFGEHSICEFTEDSIRSNVSVVSQNPYLFNMSIKDNLLLANPNATMDMIVDACKKAFIHNIIMSKTNGYDEIIGENGVQLSGGQRQRIAIARALLKKSNIILFDEATSALDNRSQNVIKRVIKNLAKNHTVIVIAHRLSTIYDADRIFVLDNHEVSAQGTHEELLQYSKIYKELYAADEEAGKTIVTSNSVSNK